MNGQEVIEIMDEEGEVGGLHVMPPCVVGTSVYREFPDDDGQLVMHRGVVISNNWTPGRNGAIIEPILRV